MTDKLYRWVDGRSLPDLDTDIVIQQEDGDKLDITFNPSNSVPDASIPEADDIDDLAAHLKGIDTVLVGSSGSTVQIKDLLYNTDSAGGVSKAQGDVLKSFNVTTNNDSDKVLIIVSFHIELSSNGEYTFDVRRAGTNIKKMGRKEDGYVSYFTSVIDEPGVAGIYAYDIYTTIAPASFTFFLQPSTIIAIVF